MHNPGVYYNSGYATQPFYGYPVPPGSYQAAPLMTPPGHLLTPVSYQGSYPVQFFPYPYAPDSYPAPYYAPVAAPSYYPPGFYQNFQPFAVVPPSGMVGNSMELTEFVPSTGQPVAPVVEKSPSPVDPLLEIAKKKCKKCSRFYGENEESVCHYHSGVYRNAYTSSLAVGRYSSWTCCSEPTRDAIGCKIGTHVECEVTSENLKRASKLMYKKPVKPTPNSQVDDLIDFNSKEEIRVPSTNVVSSSKVTLDIDDVVRMDASDGKRYIRHHVQMTDTVVGLGFKYAVEPSEIKRINRLRTDEELWTRSFVNIPATNAQEVILSEAEKARIQAELRKKLLLRFKRLTNCRLDEEALFYLESNDFNFNTAVQSYQDDIKFEQTKPFQRSKLVK